MMRPLRCRSADKQLTSKIFSQMCFEKLDEEKFEEFNGHLRSDVWIKSLKESRHLQ